ncbi:DUF3048 domain-containing protein [Candidatus Saccharibacteria bacterium]|nr:DUF3048 domain-containing protein [Candidatus Saccharibacteria bacterium]
MELSGAESNLFDKQNPFKRFFSRFNRKQKIILGVTAGVIALILLTFGIVFAVTRDNVNEEIAETPKEEIPDDPVVSHYAPLTGLPLDEEFPANHLVIAAIIENSTAARPQSGLAEAEIIYETIANGGISRFIALYQVNRPALMGPMRSLRNHFADWTIPFDAAMAHHGGSDTALADIARPPNRSIQTMTLAGTEIYWRIRERQSPHNLYTNIERLTLLATSRGYTTSNFTIPFLRSDEPATSTVRANQVNLNMAQASMNVVYRFDEATSTYLRSFATGAAHHDREHGQLAPRVVIAIRVNSRTVSSDFEDVTTTGNGEAFVFQDGYVISARWQKLSRSAPLELFDTAGHPIVLARGQTWITAVPNNNTISWQ